jgi:2-C-methyl-D-erythritol 2,4-cyclodiphosphate synthase
MMIRIGHGYDVHRLTEGRKLIVGGVRIPYEQGLLGHSDADVLAHAVSDALLGAAGLGDIGSMFPDDDPATENADSIHLLRLVVDRLRENGWRPVNLDGTVVAQRPKMKPYIPAMRQRLAEACGLTAAEVNVKATTEEGLGFTGTGEGIAAHAVCLIESV